MLQLRIRSKRRTACAGNLRRVKPAVIPPDESILAELTAAERKRVEQLLSAPYAYVRNAGFRKRDALERPGMDREPEPLMDVHMRPARRSGPGGVLSAEQERRLFYRFNYARYRVCCLLRRNSSQRLSRRATHALLRWDRAAEEARVGRCEQPVARIAAPESVFQPTC